MRSFAFASILAAAALGACTAVDNFDDFKFVSDGGTGDLAGTLPGFGQPCTDACQAGTLGRPLMCFKSFGPVSVPGGICTRSCSMGAGVIACSDYPEAVCTTVENMDVCLPRCDVSQGRTCRPGFACCAGNVMVQGPGACAPPTTNLCGG